MKTFVKVAVLAATVAVANDASAWSLSSVVNGARKFNKEQQEKREVMLARAREVALERRAMELNTTVDKLPEEVKSSAVSRIAMADLTPQQMAMLSKNPLFTAQIANGGASLGLDINKLFDEGVRAWMKADHAGFWWATAKDTAKIGVVAGVSYMAYREINRDKEDVTIEQAPPEKENPAGSTQQDQNSGTAVSMTVSGDVNAPITVVNNSGTYMTIPAE